MSYSFNVRAATKAEAAAKVGEEFQKVVDGQPIHAKDRAAAVAAAENIIDVLQDDPERDVTVSVIGYVSWTDDPDYAAGGQQITQASVSVAANLVDR